MRTLIPSLPGAIAFVAISVWLLPTQARVFVWGTNILPWVLPCVLAAALVEGVVLSFRPRGYDWRSWFTSSAMAMARHVIELAPLSLVGPAFAFAWRQRLGTIHLGSVASFGLLILGQEFCYYWLHRASHRVRWFWATHAVHHSPNDYTLSAAYRLGWTSKLSGEAAFNLPLVWIGFRPGVIAATVLFSLLYQFWLHTELVPRLGWLEWVLNTPSHHRVHHASNRDYLDKNYGGMLIVFDRLFGTMAEERPDEPCRYGLTTPLHSYNPIVIALHEWGAMLRDVAAACTWRERLGQVVGPPGWQPKAVNERNLRPERVFAPRNTESSDVGQT